jgi:hypothetical protein
VESIPRPFLLFLVLWFGVYASVGNGQERALPPWREAPAYVALFAPVNQRESYSAAVSRASLDDVLAHINDDASAGQAPGSWQARRLVLRIAQ